MSKIANQYISGRLIKRYKRFFADIQLDNSKETITAHCPNTGSMQGLLEEGNPVFVTRANDPKRKLKYTLEIIKSGIPICQSQDELVKSKKQRPEQEGETNG